MTTHNTTAHRLAIAAGAAATVGALAILCSDALTSGHWTLDHALLPLFVGITILAGHLFGSAGWRRPLSASGFAVLFVFGTGITLYTSMGRQAATADKQMADAAAVNAELTAKSAEVKAAKTRWEAADGQATKEMTGQKCLDRCQAWKTRAADIQARIDVLEAGMRRLGGTQVIAPRADKAAEILAVFGADKAAAKRAFITFEPSFYSLFLEMAAIVAFGFGFGGRQSQRVEVTPTPGPVVTADATTTGQERRAVVVSFVAAQTARQGRAPALAAIQAMHLSRFGVKLPKSTASRWRLRQPPPNQSGFT